MVAERDRRGSMRGALATAAAVFALVLGGASEAQERAPAAGATQVTGIRAWPNPGGTRIVF